MNDNLTVMKYCFPELSKENQTPLEYTKTVLNMMREDGSIDYNGFLTEEDFIKDISGRVENISTAEYRVITDEQRVTIDSLVEQACSASMAVLPHPDTPLFVFVVPWYPSDDDLKKFGGVTAVARHSRVMHLFVNANDFSSESLIDTVTHEFNHLVYYSLYGLGPFSLEENMFMEGLAEVFKDEITKNAISPWANALSDSENSEVYKSLQPRLKSQDQDFIKEVLFGSENFKRWTGYSIGYWLAKKFREQNVNSSWEGIMKNKKAHHSEE